MEVASLLEERHWSRGGFVLITGPAGIGKTRLAEEACARAVGYRVVWNWCGGPGEGSLHPWPRVVRALAAGNASVSRLARRSAHLSAAGPVGPRPLPLGGEAASGVERRQLFDDVSEILAAAAAEEKFLLVLDDLHDAGPSSLELLAAAAPTFQSNGVVVLATARDDEFSWRSAPDLRGPLVRHTHRVALGPLTDAQVGELLRSVGGTDADAGLADVVARRTGGNPLLVVELAKSLREGDDALNTAVPFSVEAMVAERTSAFPAACRALLAVAAVLGPRFRLDVLADAADVPLADVRDVLDGAERAGIVSFTEPGEGRFAHELVRDSIYGSLSAPERTRRHGEVASVLMRLGEHGRGVGAAEIASHLVLAGTGDAARATDFAWRAGDDARRIAAYADAARWYDQAIRCLDLAGGEDGQRCELLLASGEAHLGGGDRSAARAEFARVAALAVEVALPTFLARATLSLSSGSAGFEVDMFDREQIDLLWEAHAALPEEEAVLRALVAARLSIALTMMDPEGQRGAFGAGGDHPRPGRSRQPRDRSGARCTLRRAGGSRPCAGSAAVCRRDVAARDDAGRLVARAVGSTLSPRREPRARRPRRGRRPGARVPAPGHASPSPAVRVVRAVVEGNARTARRAVRRGGRGQRRGGRDRRTGGQHERRPALRHPALVPARRDR